jgi:hypothetical protein
VVVLGSGEQHGQVRRSMTTVAGRRSSAGWVALRPAAPSASAPVPGEAPRAGPQLGRKSPANQVRGHLAREQFERAYASGMALSPDEALDLATGKGPPSLIFP